MMFGYRKLILAGLSIVAAFILALLGKLTSDFAWIVSVAVGGYHAADAWTTGNGNGKPPVNPVGH